MIFIRMFLPLLTISVITLPQCLNQPIQETPILENVIISNYTGPLNEHSLGTYFDRVGNLHIENSSITDLSKNALKLLSRLENLTISNSQIHKSEDDILPGCCPSLRNLKVTNWTNFEEEELGGIGSLPLETLVITHQNLSVIGDDVLKNTNLKYLCLDHNGIRNFSHDVFDDLYQLERLSISWNDFDELPKDVLVPLKKLKTLHLETDRFQRFSLVNLTYLPELTEIFLTKTKMKEVNLWGIEEKAPKLRDVFLVGNDGYHIDDSVGPAIHY